MEEISTKERILNEALVCFSTNGYKGTNLRDLASNLNLSKSALYRHFSSKEDIWNALLDQMIMHYEKNFGSMSNMPKIPDSTEELLNLSLGMIQFTVNDERIILIRKVLLTEQFHDERIKSLATEHFLLGTKRMYTEIFEKMICKGILKEDHPEMMALEFTAPITVLIHTCDRETEKKNEYMKEIEAFIRYFISKHKVS